MTVSNSTIQAEGLTDFFKNLDKKGLNVSKNGKKTYWRTQDEPWKLLQILLQQQFLGILKI